MSEKLYALLLRMYPRHFRGAYGDEAMQVFRDRLRDDRGFPARVRLWFDVLADLGRSVPQEYRRAARAAAATPVPGMSGVPSFYMLEDEAPRPGTFVFGAALALAGLGTFVFLLSHGGNTLHFRMASYGALQSRVSPSGWGAAAAPPPAARAPGVFQLNEAEQHRVIQAIIGEMTTHYRGANGARKIAEALATREADGDYAEIAEGDIFAAALTTQMHAITTEPEVSVFFAAAEAPPGPGTWYRVDEHFSITILGKGQRASGLRSEP